MKLHISAGILLLFLFLSQLSLQAQPIDTVMTFRHDGMLRTYQLHLPENLAPNAPLVFVLHGYGGSNEPAGFGMNAVADRYGFALCYPQGEKDGRGNPCWNVGYPFQAGLKTDDIDFVCRLVRFLQRKYKLSRRHTFCTGMSNGGEMCYQLAAQRPRYFAAVAPISGLMMQWLYRTTQNDMAIPLLEIHGTIDQISQWQGDATGAGGWGEYMPVEMAIGYWVAKNRCVTYLQEHFAADTNRLEMIKHIYSGGINGHEVRLYEVVGGDHAWSFSGYDTGELIWEFFSQYIR